MLTPGESLKQEREAQNKTLEEMAEATGIRLDFLTALEQDAYETLPGRGFGKLYIRAYAEVLGFDARPVIDAYDRAQNARPAGASYATPFTPPPVEAMMGEPELEEPEPEGEEPPQEPQPELEEPEPDPFAERWAKEGWQPREQVAAPEPEPEPVPQPVETVPIRVTPVREPLPEVLPPTAPPPRRPWLRTAAVLLLLLTAVVIAISVRYRRAEASPAPVVALPQPTPAPVRPAPAPKEPPPPSTLPSTSHLRVPEFDIGDGDRFQAGQRVTFTTRVQGGRSGDRIRHVWMRDGKVEQSISLPVGASNWRTHSTKTVGRPGAWSVEARDADGQVLARASFDVVTR